MIVPDRLVQAFPPHEPHGVKRPALLVDAQAVDRHDPRMLEPAGDLGLEQEPRAAVGVVGAFGLDLLQGHLALQLGVERDRDLADPPLSVRAKDAKPHPRGCGIAQKTFSLRRLAVYVLGRDAEIVGDKRVVITRAAASSPMPAGARSVVLAVLGDRRQGGMGARATTQASPLFELVLAISAISRHGGSPLLR